MLSDTAGDAMHVEQTSHIIKLIEIKRSCRDSKEHFIDIIFLEFKIGGDLRNNYKQSLREMN